MISYTTFFKKTLAEYEAKVKSSSSFFNGRTDQEAMGFLVAVNSFRSELLHPTKNIKDKPTLSQNLPVTSGSYEENEIGRWLYDIELVARAQAKKSKTFHISNEDIAKKIFKDQFTASTNIKPLLKSGKFWVTICLSIFIFSIILILAEFGYVYILQIHPTLNRPWFGYLVACLLLFIAINIPLLLPQKIVDKNLNILCRKIKKYFIVFSFIAYIYIVPFEESVDPKTKATTFLATTVFLSLTLRSLILNTKLPAGYHDINIRKMRIFLEILMAELAFVSTIIFLEPIITWITKYSKCIVLLFFVIYLLAIILSSIVSNYFDQMLSKTK